MSQPQQLVDETMIPTPPQQLNPRRRREKYRKLRTNALRGTIRDDLLPGKLVRKGHYIPGSLPGDNRDIDG